MENNDDQITKDEDFSIDCIYNPINGGGGINLQSYIRKVSPILMVKDENYNINNNININKKNKKKELKAEENEICDWLGLSKNSFVLPTMLLSSNNNNINTNHNNKLLLSSLPLLNKKPFLSVVNEDIYDKLLKLAKEEPDINIKEEKDENIEKEKTEEKSQEKSQEKSEENSEEKSEEKKEEKSEEKSEEKKKKYQFTRRKKISKPNYSYTRKKIKK